MGLFQRALPCDDPEKQVAGKVWRFYLKIDWSEVF